MMVEGYAEGGMVADQAASRQQGWKGPTGRCSSHELQVHGIQGAEGPNSTVDVHRDRKMVASEKRRARKVGWGQLL